LAFKHLCTLFDFNKLSLKDVEDISAATLLTIEQVMADEFMLKLNLMRNVVRNKFDESDLFFVKKTMEGDWIKYARNKKKILEIDMRCSNCGSDTNAYGKRCLVCGLILEKAKQEGGAKESKKKEKYEMRFGVMAFYCCLQSYVSRCWCIGMVYLKFKNECCQVVNELTLADAFVNFG